MKKNVFKILMSLAFVFTVIGGFSAINLNRVSNCVKAENEEIKYVALGDSIADGTRLEGYQKYTFVEGAYTTVYKELMEENYIVDAVTYAMASSNTSDLLALLNGEETERYADLNVDEVLTSISEANVITVCIGANDVLLPAIDNIYEFITNAKTVAEMEDILGNGLVDFQTNFPQILEKLTELNPDATIIFNDIYNPYKDFTLSESMAQLAPYAGINVDNVNKMGQITEVYLAGGTNSQGSQIIGLNSLMEGFINANGNSNFKLALAKKWFDLVITAGDEPYSTVVNADASKIDELVASEGVSAVFNFDAYADPHPTVAGHNLIALAIATINVDSDDPSDDPVNPENPDDPVNPDDPADDPVVEYVTVSFVAYGGHLTDELGVVFNKKTIEKGTKIVNYIPTKVESPFGGWYLDSKFETKWNFDDVVTEDINLYAKWINLTCENSQNKNQDITNLKEVHFSLNIEDSSDYNIAWYIESEEVLKLVEGENGTTFTFLPTKSGTFKIKAQVNGIMTKVIDVIITRSQISNITIALKQRDMDNNFVIEIMDNSYSDSELVWYKSTGEFDEEPEMICKGKSILNYKFNSNCTIWVEYADSDQVISNKLDIVVGKNAPTDIIVGVLVGILIVGAFITAVVITKRKYSDF